MITCNEANILVIEKGRMTLDIEGSLPNGIEITLSIPRAYISMTGLYQNEELKVFTQKQTNDFHHMLNHSIVTENIGTKKVLQTIFSTKNVRDKTKKDYKIIFTSEDTQIIFPLTKEEWDEFVRYIHNQLSK